jgi:hypothetical protein
MAQLGVLNLRQVRLPCPGIQDDDAACSDQIFATQNQYCSMNGSEDSTYCRYFDLRNFICVLFIVQAIPQQISKVSKSSFQGICNGFFLTL